MEVGEAEVGETVAAVAEAADESENAGAGDDDDDDERPAEKESEAEGGESKVGACGLMRSISRTRRKCAEN